MGSTGTGLVVADRHGRVDAYRDPSAATRQVQFQTPGLPMEPEWNAEQAIRWAYYANIFVYRCVQIRSQTAARVPFRVGADPSKPKDYDTNHPLARLLSPPPGGPNPSTSARQLIAWSLAQKLVTGRLGWEMELDSKDRPIAFWPLVAQYLKPIPTQSGTSYFQAFDYGRADDLKRLPARQVFYHWRPKQDDWRQPESVLQAARLDVSVAVMQDRYDVAFLRNDARPASVIIYEGFATADDDRAFRQQFRAEHQGPDNAGKALFVEAEPGQGGLSESLVVKTLGLSQKDAEFIRRYEAKVRAICIAFGTPISKLGDSSARTFANASEENRNWWEDTVLTDLEEFADAVNIQLAPLFGDNVGWFDLSGVPALAPKRVTTDVGVPSLLNAQVITYNEGRAELGLPPVEGGDRIPTVAEIQALKSGPATGGERAAVPDAKREPEAPGAETPPGLRPVLPDPAEAARVATLHRRAVAVVTTATNVEVLEASWERTFRRLFARQEEATLARLRGNRGRKAVKEQRASADEVFDPAFWRAQTEDLATDLYESVVAVAGARVSAQFGVTFDVTSPFVAQFIEERAKQLAGFVTDTTYSDIRLALNEGVSAGEGIPDLAKRITKVFDQASTTRATTIARTEVISAYNGSAVRVAAQEGAAVVGGQEWISAEDNRTREAHLSADGQIVPIGQPFYVGGRAMAYPGDPAGGASNTVNCRCTVAFLTPDEMGARRAYVEQRTALAMLALVRPGVPFDGAAYRQALNEVAAA